MKKKRFFFHFGSILFFRHQTLTSNFLHTLHIIIILVMFFFRTIYTSCLFLLLVRKSQNTIVCHNQQSTQLYIFGIIRTQQTLFSGLILKLWCFEIVFSGHQKKKTITSWVEIIFVFNPIYGIPLNTISVEYCFAQSQCSKLNEHQD